MFRAPHRLLLAAVVFSACVSRDYEVGRTQPDDVTEAAPAFEGSELSPTDPTAPDEPSASACVAYPSPAEPIHEAVTWDGRGLQDLSQRPIVSFRWELVEQPPGSTLAFEPVDSPVLEGFQPLMAGTYRGVLTGTTESGDTLSCDAELQAIPSARLWVELFWQYPGDDLDLHVVRPGGRLVTRDDCYYSNCRATMPPLDWGFPSYTPDDPILDFDDIPGVGPENINIDEPGHGDYIVYVHDYPGSVRTAENDATVNIYLDGELACSEVRTLVGEDVYLPIATVDPLTGVIVPLPFEP